MKLWTAQEQSTGVAVCTTVQYALRRQLLPWALASSSILTENLFQFLIQVIELLNNLNAVSMLLFFYIDSPCSRQLL